MAPAATSNVATVSITVSANRAPVAADDTFSAPVAATRRLRGRRSSTVLANDSDPDTAIDATNVINPATVAISTPPNKGGSVDGQCQRHHQLHAQLNFRGTEVFSVPGQGQPDALSNAATVRVNVN